MSKEIINKEAFLVWAYAKFKENDRIAHELIMSKKENYAYYKQLSEAYLMIPSFIALYEKELEGAENLYTNTR